VHLGVDIHEPTDRHRLVHPDLTAVDDADIDLPLRLLAGGSGQMQEQKLVRDLQRRDGINLLA
jgi:hypothetical protein